jgi:hypothetical protein
MRFSLRTSAYLCVLCVEIAVKRRERRDTQRAAEKWLSVADAIFAAQHV